MTNAFSKKIDNHIHALSVYLVWYNWVRLQKITRVTRAIAAGLTDMVMDMADVTKLIDEYEASRKARAA